RASSTRDPAVTQGVLALGPGRLVVVGGQDGGGTDGQVVGEDLGEQTRQARRNVVTVLAEAGAPQEHVVRLAVYYAAGQDVDAGFRASSEAWGQHPTAITVIAVPGFARPGVLVEIEAMAFVPEDRKSTRLNSSHVKIS